MSAGPAIEMWSRQSGSAESPDGKTRILTMVRAFTITLDASDALEEVYNASGLPLVGYAYPGTSYVICKKLTPSRLSPVLAMIQADYSGEIGPGGASDSPIDTEVTLTWRNATTEEAIDQDFDGKPICTVNDEPIDGITERISDQLLTIDRNFQTINMYAIRRYLRSVNSDSYSGWPPGTGRLIDYQATNIITNGVAGFWKVSASIQFREPYNTTAEKAWHHRVRHEGFMVRENATDGPEDARPAWDGIKGLRTKPVLLKEDGTQELDSDNAHWLEFKTLEPLPYSALGLI